MKNDQIETVVLVHAPSELKVILKKFPLCRETLYCTLSPYASNQCEKEGVSYTPLESFGLNTDPIELRDEIHQSLLKTIALADRITQKYHSTESYISPYRASFRRLAILLAGTKVRIHYLSALITKTKARRIVWFGKPAWVLGNYKGNKAFSDDGSVEIALLKFQQWEGIDLVDLSAEFKKLEQNSAHNLLNRKCKQYIFRLLRKWDFIHSVNFYIKMLKTANWNFIKSYLFSSKKNILIENSTPFWLKTGKVLLQRGCKIHHAKNYMSYVEDWKSGNELLKKELRKALFASEIFNWKKMEWTDFIFPLIGHLSSLVDPLKKIAHDVESLTTKRRINCLLTIGAHREYKYALIRGAKMAGVKVITFQHGGFGAYGGIYMGYDDLFLSDFHICPGPGDAQLHKKINPNFANKCKPLGFTNSNFSAVKFFKKIGSQKKGSEKKQQTLLYTTTQYYLNQGVFLELGSPDNASLVYKNQKIIISGLKRLMDNYMTIKTIMKLHPQERKTNIPSLGKDLEDERFTVIHKKPDIPNLLRKSDIILIDTPQTVLIQSVTTRKPLFILNSHVKLFPQAKELLMQRAVVKDDPYELVDALEDYLLTGFYPADTNNTEFLSFFSDPFCDGRLFERAADLVVEACSKPNLT